MNIGFLGLLSIIFVIGKVFGYIDWSWWLVFTPAIISFVLTFTILLLAARGKMNE